MLKSALLKLRILLSGIALVGIFFNVLSATASTTNGTVDTTNKYAWSSNLGWVNFNAAGGNIQITDAGITGYAWSANAGWINMKPTNGGVLIAANGNLSGYAWGAGADWINFSGVSINSSGKFVGQATGVGVGTLTFDCTNCNVTTDYRASNFRTVVVPPGSGGGGGGLPLGSSNPPIAPAGGFSVLINGGAATTQSQTVTLSLGGGPDTTRMAISNTPDFANSFQEAYSTSKVWTLAAGEGVRTVYVRFYTQYGYASDTFSDSIGSSASADSVEVTFPISSGAVTPSGGQGSTPSTAPAAPVAPQAIPSVLFDITTAPIAAVAQKPAYLIPIGLILALFFVILYRRRQKEKRREQIKKMQQGQNNDYQL